MTTGLKKIGKSIVVAVLASQLRRLRTKNTIKTIGVVGSYGKTSTKFALATVLGNHFHVRFQEGNYNETVSVPLVFFGETMPSLLNPFAWIAIFVRNELQLLRPYPYEMVIVELGIDGPGQMKEFTKYLWLDIAVVTAIGYEHMDLFSDLQALATEEFSVQHFSEQLVVNSDLCAADFRSMVTRPMTTFGYSEANYRLKNIDFGRTGYRFDIERDGIVLLHATYPGEEKTQLYAACAATAVGDMLGMPREKIVEGTRLMKPVSGRMQRLRGIRNSVIIDESYNSSPGAAKMALDILYETEAAQRIALLGNMNELGKFSADAHRELGEYCDPSKLDLIITLGPDANEYLAPIARSKGCQVKECSTPYEAGEYLKGVIIEGAVVLVKGSQNNVFAEEAIKMILADPADERLLVRQSPEWMRKKQKSFIGK